VSFYACFKFSQQRLKLGIVPTLCRFVQPSNPFGCFALRFPAGLFRTSLVQRAEHECPALRNFDTEPHSSYCYEVYSDNRLESVANAHTAADLHVRPVS
jgi:hypothetical protein